jgi:hypothetical protein
MTKQVRTSYRRHRKATWAVMLALVGVIAAVVIPIASGTIANDDNPKTYTLGFGASSTLTQTLCTTAGSVVLTLTNTTRSTTLGSAEITFPSFATVTSSGLTANKGTVGLVSSKNKITLRSLGLAKGQAVTITVPFSSLSSGGPLKLVTVVKKTSNFSGDEDDVFRSAPAPTLKVIGCATIAGQVFNDRNGNGTFEAVSTPGDTALAWDVYLYRKDGANYLLDQPKLAAGSDGNYTFTGVQTGKDYRLCVKAAGTDTAKAWALEKPTGNSNCSAISGASDSTSAAIELPALAASAAGQDFAVVQVTAPVPCGGESAVTDYQVKLGNDANQTTSTANCDKSTVRYVQDSFTNAGTHYFLFSPAPGAGSGEVLLVEQLESTFDDLSKLQSTLLKYDDVAPYFDNLVEMPGCTTDPRQNPATDNLLLKPNLDKSTVLPGSATSCLITYQVAVGPAPGTFTRTDYVFSAVDGGRGMG